MESWLITELRPGEGRDRWEHLLAQVASGGRTRQELVAAGGMRKRELLVAARARCMACMLRSIGFPIVQCIIGVFRGTIRSKSCTVFGELYFVRFSLIFKIDGGGAQYIRRDSPRPSG